MWVKSPLSEAVRDRPHAVHGEDRGQGRPADTGNSNYTQYVTIEATKPVKAEYKFETTKHIAIPLISKASKSNEIIESTGVVLTSEAKVEYNTKTIKHIVIPINPK